MNFNAAARGILFALPLLATPQIASAAEIKVLSSNAAQAMLKAGFPPDVISSDVHVRSIDGPAYSTLHTMSKMLCLDWRWYIFD